MVLPIGACVLCFCRGRIVSSEPSIESSSRLEVKGFACGLWVSSGDLLISSWLVRRESGVDSGVS